MDISRRQLLRSGAAAVGGFVLVPAFLRDALAAPAMAGPSPYGPLGGADVNGLELPAGFTSRRIAVAGQAVGPHGYVLPPYPDGEATFKTADGGWILVTNSESAAAVGGGTSAIRFAADGTITDAYRILGGTSSNCAGGPTPWGTWLSGEELSRGLIWECDPAGKLPAQSRPACGAFAHEAAAIDPVNRRAFLTEDDPAGGFYRLSPANYPYLTAGTLQCAEIAVDSTIIWHVVPDPTTTMTGTATRLQVPQMTKFGGGEGIWYANGVCYFTTKADKKVWAYTIATNTIEVLYDHFFFPASLDAVDNVTVSAFGDVYVCEDGGNLEIGLITPTRLVSPFLRFSGAAHAASEICGVVFNPSQQRLYCTSQRAEIVGGTAHGAIYEITGPFRIPPTGIPADLTYGPPAGEREAGPLTPATSTPPPPPPPPPAVVPPPPPPPSGADTRRPGLKVTVRPRVARVALLAKGIEVRVSVDEPSAVAVVLDSQALEFRKVKGDPTPRPKTTLLARVRKTHKGDGTELKVRLKLGKTPRGVLRRKRRTVQARLMVTARDNAGNERTVVKKVTIGPVL